MRRPRRPTRTHQLYPYTSLLLSFRRGSARDHSGLCEANGRGTERAANRQLGENLRLRLLAVLTEQRGAPLRVDDPGRRPVKDVTDDVRRGTDERQDGSESRRPVDCGANRLRSEEHTSELQSLMRISYAVFCL